MNVINELSLHDVKQTWCFIGTCNVYVQNLSYMLYKVKTEAFEVTNHKCGLLWKPWVYVKSFYLPYDAMSIIGKRHIHQIEVNKVICNPVYGDIQIWND